MRELLAVPFVVLAVAAAEPAEARVCARTVGPGQIVVGLFIESGSSSRCVFAPPPAVRVFRGNSVVVSQAPFVPAPSARNAIARPRIAVRSRHHGSTVSSDFAPGMFSGTIVPQFRPFTTGRASRFTTGAQRFTTGPSRFTTGSHRFTASGRHGRR